MKSSAYRIGIGGLLVLLILGSSLFHAHAQQPAPAANGFDVAGTVVNLLTGDPVRGATLRLTPHGENKAVAEARSGNDGGFRFAGVPAGKYQLQAARSGYTRSLYEQHGSFNSAVVVNAEQDTAHLLFRLPPLSWIRGSISGDGGEPAAGARVLLFRKPGTEDPEGRTYLAANTSTDDTGTYEFADLAPGEYLIAVQATPWYALHTAGGEQASSDLDVAFPLTYFDSTTEEAAATPLQVAAGNHIEANINLHAVPALRITITHPGAKDAPPPPAELQQSVFGTMGGMDTEGEVRRNSRGEMEIYGIAPGHYQLFSGQPAHALPLDAASSLAVDSAAGVSSSAITGKLQTAPGVLFDPLAAISLVPDDPNQQTITVLSNGGTFSLPQVAAGTWTITIRNGYGHSLQVHSIEIAHRRIPGNRFTATGLPMELLVTATQGAVNVTGVAQKDGKGLAGAMLVLVPTEMKNFPALARRDQSDSDGSFVLLNVVAGSYTVVAIQDGWDLDWSKMEVIARYLPAGSPVTLPADATGELRLERPVAVQPR